MHCIYCGASIPVTRIMWASAPPSEQTARSAFEDQHEASCGEKPVCVVMDVPEVEEQ